MCVWCVWGEGGGGSLPLKKLKCLNKKKNIKVLIAASVVSTASTYISRQIFYFLSQWTISFVYVNVFDVSSHISLDHIKKLSVGDAMPQNVPMLCIFGLWAKGGSLFCHSCCDIYYRILFDLLEGPPKFSHLLWQQRSLRTHVGINRLFFHCSFS